MNNTAHHPPRTPDEQLAERIARALATDGLIANGKSADVRRKLAAGTAKAADWKAWASQGLDDPERLRARQGMVGETPCLAAEGADGDTN